MGDVNSLSTGANILVFDSGVGGLSIVEHIRQLSPQADITYLADNSFFPYGLLSEKKLIDRVSTLLKLLMSKLHIDIVVIACNTASTLVLPVLRMTLNIPVVGVVPAIKPAVLLSNSNIIGLLATPGTIKREYTEALIRNFAHDCQVVRVGSSKLVEVVERSARGDVFDSAVYRDILSPFFYHPRWKELDTIVLACTHFPLAKSQLAIAAPEITHWVDSGKAIAQRISILLKDSPSKLGQLKDSISKPAQHRDNRVFLTDISKNTLECSNNFKRYGFDRVDFLEI
ncbi:MAG: glutamate racemase [Gammaproteobacteria bacterium]|jgi:glutamate racemase